MGARDWYFRSLKITYALYAVSIPVTPSGRCTPGTGLMSVRASQPPGRPVNAVIEKAATPFERIAARRWASRSEPVSVVSGACEDA